MNIRNWKKVYCERGIGWEPTLEETAFNGWVDKGESANKTEKDKAD